MCFGGGRSAQKIYEQQKPDFGALPSLSMNVTKRDINRLKDVKGKQPRSLLQPLQGDYNA